MAVTIRRLVRFLGVLLAGLVLAACTSSTSGSGSSAGVVQSHDSPAGKAGASSAGGGATGGMTDRVASGVVSAGAVTAAVVREASVVVQVDGELAAAAAKVRAVAASLGGTVSSETTTYADTGGPPPSGTTGGTSTPGGGKSAPASAVPVRPGESVLVLRVPEPMLDRALGLVGGAGGVGRELSRWASAQDVTADLADLESRVATQRASVTRVRALLAKARTLQDVVTLESEVTKRESELEAVEARRAALAGRADLATLTVDLRTGQAAAPPARPANAFLDALHSGWHAVAASTVVILTVLGALLPIAVVLAVAGAPALWWIRRRRPRRGMPPATPAPSADPGP